MRKRLLWSAGIALLYLLIVWRVAGIYFETNDDRFFTEILSGALTGAPDPHTIYMNYFLSWPLSLLYRVTVGIPWYGIMLITCHFAVYTALLQSIGLRMKTVKGYVVSAGLVLFIALINLYITINIQYTSTAAMLAAAGYVCLLLREDRKKGLTMFFCFELAAFLLRDQAMLMIQPLGAAAYLGTCLLDDRTGKKECLMRMAGMILAAGVIFIIGIAGSLIGYRGKGWEDYQRFNQARTEMFDFYGVPVYEEVKPILDEYEVTRAEYEAFCNYVTLDWDISTECVEALADYAESRHNMEMDMKSRWKQAWEKLGAEKHLMELWVVIAAWLVLLPWAILWKRFSLLLPLGGMMLGRLAVWGYLIYGGRLMQRVTRPLLAAETILLAALLIRDYSSALMNPQSENMGAGGRQKRFLAVSAAVLAVCCLLSGKQQYSEAVAAGSWQKDYIKGLAEVEDYCRMHPENRYLLDAWSFCYYRGGVFETRISGPQNCVYSGGWFSNSPVLYRHLEQYQGRYDRDICLMIYETEDSWESKPIVAFLTEKFGGGPVLEDRLTVSHGGSYLILRFKPCYFKTGNNKAPVFRCRGFLERRVWDSNPRAL